MYLSIDIGRFQAFYTPLRADSLSAHCGFLWITNRHVTDWQKTESTPIVYTGLIHSNCQYILDSEKKRWSRFRYRYVWMPGQAIQASKSINGTVQLSSIANYITRSICPVLLFTWAASNPCYVVYNIYGYNRLVPLINSFHGNQSVTTQVVVLKLVSKQPLLRCTHTHTRTRNNSRPSVNFRSQVHPVGHVWQWL